MSHHSRHCVNSMKTKYYAWHVVGNLKKDSLDEVSKICQEIPTFNRLVAPTLLIQHPTPSLPSLCPSLQFFVSCFLPVSPSPFPHFLSPLTPPSKPPPPIHLPWKPLECMGGIGEGLPSGRAEVDHVNKTTWRSNPTCHCSMFIIYPSMQFTVPITSWVTVNLEFRIHNQVILS